MGLRSSLLTLLLTLVCAAAGKGRLDVEPSLASSGCKIVTEALSRLLRHPPPEVASRVVTSTDGSSRAFTSTPQFLDNALLTLCGSPLLWPYRPVLGLLGVSFWEEDSGENHLLHATRAPHPRMTKLCRRLVSQHRPEVEKALRRGDVSAACAVVAPEQPQQASMFKSISRTFMQLKASPLAIWRLVPVAIVVIALPFVFAAPFRFARDATVFDADAAGPGCLPGAAGMPNARKDEPCAT